MRRLAASPASFVGREKELKRVARLWAASRVVLVLGAAGIGKTALLRRLVEQLGEGTPAPVAEAGSAPLLERLEAAIGLPALGTSDEDRALRVADAVDRDGASLCVEDVHELAPADWDRVLGIAGQLRRGRLLVTSRRRVRLGDLAASAIVVELGPLSRAETAALVGDLAERLGRDLDSPAIARHAGGSPLRCRLLAGGAAGTAEHAAELLSGLDPDARLALERLCAFREPVPPSLLGSGARVLRELEDRFLVERIGEPERIGVHPFVREAVLSKLDDGSRRALHRFCAEALESGNGAFEAGLEHLDAAGDGASLARALHDGGAAWLWSHRRIGDLLRLTDAAVGAGATLTPRLHLRRALCFAVSGDVAAARRDLESAGTPSRADAFLHGLVRLAVEEEAGTSAALRAERYLALVREAPPSTPPADLGQAVNGFVRDCLVRGDLQRAFDVYAEVAATPDRIDDLSRARIARRLGDFLSEQGNAGRAVEALTGAEAAARALQSPQLVAAAHNCWIEHHVRTGDLRAAARHLAESDATPVPAGQFDTAAIREIRRAQVLLARGEIAPARRVLDASLRRGSALAAALHANLLGEAAWAAAVGEDLDAARRLARSVLLSPVARRPRVAWLNALAASSRVARLEGRTTSAVRRARVLVESASRATLHERAVRGRVLVAEAFAQAGRTAEALEAADESTRTARATSARPLEAEAWLARAFALLRSGDGHRERSKDAMDAAERALDLASSIGAVALSARAEAMLAWCDLAGDSDDAARDRIGRARAAHERCPGLPLGELRVLERLLRARGGSRPALAEVEDAARRAAGAPVLPVEPSVLRALARPGRRVAVTRHGPMNVSAASPPADHDVCMDAETGRVVVDGAREIDLARRPVARRLLELLLAEPGARRSRAGIFEAVWRLPYRAARDETVAKAVERLAALLDPRGPPRLVWDHDGKLDLRFARPCLVRRALDSSLNDRQKWVLSALERKDAVSNRDLRAALDVPRATAQRDLEHLVSLGLLRREGRGRATTYRRS